MPDFQNFQIQRAAPAQVNVPTHTIEVSVQEGQTVLADFTGENAIRFPSVLATLTPEQQDEVVADLAPKLIQWKAGLG